MSAKKKVRRRKIKSKFTRQMQIKLGIMFGVVVLALFALCVRIIQLDVTKKDEYAIKILSQQGYSSTTVPYKRGDITDRNGNVLATSVMVYDMVIDCKVILSDDDYFDATVYALVKYFGADEEKIRASIKKRSDSNYWIYKKGLEYSDIEEYQSYISGDYATSREERTQVANTKGIWFEKRYKRMYPYDSLACSVLGFSSSDNVATTGIECSYSDYLEGVDGREYGYMDNDNSMESVIRDSVDGDTVVSSIDMNIQRIVQKSIKKYKKKYNPKRIAVVIADPNTGEILAMADDTTFDLNNPSDLSDYYSKEEIESMSDSDQSEKLNEIWKNYCVSDSYEPGSTAKPFTVAAAYEEGLVDSSSTFYCDGYEKVGGFTIKCHKTEGHGTISLMDAVAQSCNDYMMHIGALLGAETFTKYQTAFGFGTKTGIDLPQETRGLVYEADEMGASTLATNSFGQNFTVNMVQMVAAFSSLINGGDYYEPHVVKQVVEEDGELVKDFLKNLVSKTVTRDTSNYIKECLRAVVTQGTGTTAAIDGYTVGGKTGTAEKVDTSGNGTGRLEGQYILSFLGCVPCENPKVVCYTLMDTPEGDPQGTAKNTELWKNIMEQVLPYLGIEQTEKVETKAKKKSLESEFYSDGIIEGDDGSLILGN